MKLYRGLLAALAVVVALIVAPSAQAAFPSVFGGAAPCTTLSSNGNIRYCTGYTLTWDGKTKIDVNVFLPPETGGADGPYPMIGDFHGWGSSKQGLNEVPPKTEKTPGGLLEAKDPRIQHWAEEGYAVFSMSDRGWGLSCGALDPTKGEPFCANGYNHLMDDRYEVRDAQYLMSVLAQEGVAKPDKIGATGVSYGGGLSTALATLRNRIMLPNGQLAPWTTPSGTPMELAAAAPQWPWTDIAYSLAPNGRNLDYVTDSSYRGPEGKFPVGVWKASFSEYLYQAGKLLSNYNEANPEANIPGWIQRLKGGEPYTDATVNGIIKLLSTFHSSYGIEPSVEPSPLLIQSGWNDDLFPVDEALRLYQRTRALYPGNPISLYLADIGHARSQNKEADVAAFNQRLEAWFAYYLKGEGQSPSSSVEATTTTCPKSTPSEGPYRASDWSGLAPGEIRFTSDATQTFFRNGPFELEPKPTTTSGAFDPILGPGACVAVPAAAAEEKGVAAYSFAPAPEGGYTLMGSPTIIADLEVPSPNSEVAVRLVDVSPEGTETLVARTLYRPDGGENQAVFQLHPQGYRFAPGHVAKLEFLSSDYPYGRFSNLQTPITVSDLELRLPVTDQPGALGGLVQKPAPKVVPPGYTLAAEYKEAPVPEESVKPPAPKPPAATAKVGVAGLAGKFTANTKNVMVPVQCTGDGACSGQIVVKVKPSSGKGLMVLARGSYSLGQGKRAKVMLPVTKNGRNVVTVGLETKGKRGKIVHGAVNFADSGQSKALTLKRPVHLTGGK
jgi:predicted acyl esterase